MHHEHPVSQPSHDARAVSLSQSVQSRLTLRGKAWVPGTPEINFKAHTLDPNP